MENKVSYKYIGVKGIYIAALEINIVWFLFFIMTLNYISKFLSSKGRSFVCLIFSFISWIL